VSRRDQPHVNAVGAATSETFEFMFLQNTEQLGLQCEWYVAHFIKKKGPFVSQFEAANFLRYGPGEGTPLMAKELTFQQIEGNGRTVQLDKRPSAARADVVNRVRDQLLPGPCFSLNEDCGVCASNALHVFEDHL
jgi:hypothetical protein